MAIRSMTFTPDSQHLITASDDKRINIYDVQHANIVSTLTGHQSWVLSVSASPTGKEFATGCEDSLTL
jgi:WD repeat-containing protein 61